MYKGTKYECFVVLAQLSQQKSILTKWSCIQKKFFPIRKPNEQKEIKQTSVIIVNS